MGPVLFLARSLGLLLLHLMAGILGHHGIIGPYTCRPMGPMGGILGHHGIIGPYTCRPMGPMGPVLLLARSPGLLLLHLIGHHGIIGPYTCRPMGPMGAVLLLARSLGLLLLHLMAGILGHHGMFSCWRGALDYCCSI